MPRRLVIVALFLVGLYACGSSDGDGGSSGGRSGTKTFSNGSYPFTFKYPKDFHVTNVSSVAQTAGGGATSRVAIAADEDNAIFLARSEADDIAITASNIRDVLPEVDDVVSSLVGKPADGTVQTFGGFPGVLYEGLDVAAPPQGQSRMVFLFDGKFQYFLNCQSTPARRIDVEAACDLALSTLKKR